MKKSNRKSFDWYGVSQRFSIRKYHFGAASVLLGTALILGNGSTIVKADDEGASTESSSSLVTSSSSHRDVDASASVVDANTSDSSFYSATAAENPTAVASTAGSATAENLPVLSGEELAKLVKEAEEKTKTQPEAKTDEVKSSETKTEDKKEETKEEKTVAEAAIETAKTQVDNSTSEATVINRYAEDYARKEVKDDAARAAIEKAIANNKLEVEKAETLLKEESTTQEQLNLQLQNLQTAILAVYNELRKAGHGENIAVMLADETSATTAELVPPRQLVTVASLTNITDEEVAAIIKEIRSANPSLTEADKITITRTGQTNLGGATITFADGRPSVTFNSTQTILGSAGTKNLTQLQNSINWFDFSAATIIYKDGTKAGPARELSTPVEVDTTNPKTGAAMKGRITKVRDITYADGSTGLSTDAKFLNSGIAKYSVHVYYNGTYQNDREMYEVAQEGMRFQVPTRVNGYELEARVTKLAPRQVATNPNPNKEQNALRVNNNAGVMSVDDIKPVDIILTTQDNQWSYLKIAGLPLNDAQGKPALSAFTANVDGSNAGISFALSATYKGRPVDVNLIAADGEESGHAELIQFETDGSNWQELMSLNLAQYGNNGVVPTSAGNLDWWNGKEGADSKGTWTEDGYNTNEWVNKDENGNVVAYGTKLFGPFETAMRYGNALPIGFTQGVNNLSMYMNSRGAQAGVIGFIVFDGGDAPQSYGSAQHIIGNFNTEKNGAQVTATQPFLGDQPADPDFKSTATEPSGAWILDDLTYTDTDREVALTSGTSKVTNQAGDTGTFTILPNGNPVIVKADGTQVAIANGSVLSTTETITATDTNTNTTTTGLAPVRGVYNNAKQNIFVGDLPDEGEGQLLDPAVAKTYSLRQATDTEYVLEGVRMNRGVNNDVAYAYGWVDFDGNGTFDKYERSELITVNQDGTYTVSFKNTPQLLNTSIDKVGVRLRIALSEKEIMDSTGIASSGEVEDFQVAVVHPPRGTKQTSSDFQDREQSVTVDTNALFNASGKTKASNFNDWNQVAEEVAPKIVVTDSVVASEEATGNNIHIQDALGNTIYRGDEVVIKDAKGNTLGTAVKVTNPLNGTTEYYLSEYTEYDTAGNKVGTYTLNKGQEDNKNVKGTDGVYNTTINFKPEAPYVGTAKGIAIRAWDDNNNSTGWNANDLTIEKSLASETLADKDKIRENTNNNNNGRVSMDAVYIPTVIDVKPIGNNEATTDVQGKAQSAKPVIPTYGTVQTVTDGRVEDVRYDSRYVILDPTKPATLSNNRENPAKTFTTDTVVTEETTVTLPNGQDATFKPADTIANNTQINANAITITGSGNVTLNGIRYGRGTVVPAGASITGSLYAVQSDVEVIRNGQQVTLHAGDRFENGDTLVNNYTAEDSTTWRKTFQTGETIPAATSNRYASTVGTITTDQLVANGQSVTIGNASGTTTYTVNNIVPAGSTQAPTYTPLTGVTLPNAVHLDPTTGAVTVVPRRYTEVTDTKIVIENEGTYELNQQTGDVTFTPDPAFIGVGTGVDLQQPDVDYSTPVEGDPVTAKYGTDYGRARYTPTVTPRTEASITRTIRYVYEDTNQPILSVDNQPVTATQTIDYTRTYSVYGEQSSIPQTTAGHDVTDVNGRVYPAGTIIPAGTVVPAGTVIISAWTPAGTTTQFASVISPTVEGYTAEVQTPSPEYVQNTAGTGLARVVNGQGVGAYTPVTDNTEDVGTYQVNPLAVTSDNTDDFTMTVVYKADTQKARVIYIDLDDNNKVLEIQTGETAPTTGAADNTTYGVAGLSGKSDTDMTYSTADTIKSYTDRGFELAADGYTTDANGNTVARKFDTDSNTDQEYRVYLRHQKQTRQIKDTQEVKRTIEYKYADTDDVPAALRNTTAAPTETETLKFERDRIIDLAKAAELYPTEYATYKAVLDANGRDSAAEYAARVVYYDHITNQAKAADATEAQKSAVSFGQWTALTSEKTVGTEAQAGTAADKQFDQVISPDIAGYVPNNAVVEATGDIDPEATDYTVTVVYTPAEQKLTINFSEVDANGNVITPGVASPIVKGGKSGTDFPADTAAEVTARITELTNKGYELVSNGYESDSDKTFDTDSNVDQVRTVTVRAKSATVNPNDPTTPQDPQPGQPVDPNNPDGPKWPESVKNLKTTDTVKRTINYIYADGTAVGEKAPTKVEEVNFTRTATINLVTGEITYGNWSENKEFEAVTSPTIENYTATQPTVAAETVAAEASDIVHTVIYNANKIPVDPTQPTTPGGETPKPTDKVPNDPQGRTYKDLGVFEDVTRTINYIYADGSEAQPTVTETKTFTRTATIDAITGEVTYGDWSANQEFAEVATPAIDNYTPTKDSVAASTVGATANDIYETIVYNAKTTDIDPTKPTDPNNPGETPKPEDKVPNDPKGRTFAELGLIEDVTRTINYVYADGTAVRVDAEGKEIARTAENAATYSTLGTADKVVTETKRFTRTAKINSVTGDITEYGAWSADQTFAAVTSPTIENYTPTKDSVAASTVSATASDIYETVIYNATTVDVDPNKPKDPTNPNETPKPEDKVPEDPKGRTYADLGLIETVTHTVNYKLADGSDAGVPAKSETLTFTRTAKINAVTGDIIEYGEWTARNNDTTFDAVTTPVKEGYVASAKASTEITNVQATDNDSTETIIYSKLGSYVPLVPEGVTPPPGTNVTPTPYPDPTPEDPTTPGTPTTTPVVPHIPGTTPVGPDGKPLEPVTPGTPEDGYKVPPVPTDPTQNTTITYVKDGSQVAVTHFVEVNSATDRTEKGGVAESVVDTGDTGKAFNQTAIDKVASTIADLQAKGYTVVENGFNANDTFDADSSTNQEYKVLVTVNNITVNPNDPTNPTPTPQPGDPIDPNNPTGPKWTEDLIKEITENTKDTVKRTINYVYADGSQAASSDEKEVSFSRTATINPVTGQISYGAWSADQEFAAVTSPTIENYTASQATVAAETVAAEANDIVHTVIYTTTKAPVDPNKPTDPQNPGETPKPEDKIPNDPKGRTYGDLGLIKDVTRTINYVYADGSEAQPSVTESKRFTRTATIDVVTGEVTYGDWSAAQNFDAVTSPTIENYTPTQATVAASTITADSNNIVETVIYNTTSTTVDPNQPVDPTKPTDPDTNPLPKPDDKVPNDPKGRTYADLGLIETVTHTVNYKLADGSDAGVPAHIETLTFTRTAKIDAVTGAVSDYSDWTARNNDTTFDAVTTPVKEGYVASAKASTEITNVQATDNDSTETIIYSKLGSYVPVVPEGVTPPPGTNVTPTPYPDPTPEDPTTPGTPTTTPVVPHIPGTTPVGPDGKPLEPVTPGTPEDGYKVPPVPTDPTQNTTITYVKDGSQVAVVHFVDEDGNAVHTSVVEAGETGASFTKAGEVASIISELEARGYAVVANKAGQVAYPAEEARIFDALEDKGTNGPSQVYYVTVGAKTIPVDPTKPTDPTNPENPKPGDPIDPNNPEGPKWTEDLLNKLNNIKDVNRTITYVKEDGSEVDPTNAPKVTDKVTFTRVAIVKASDGSLLGYDTNGDGIADVPATDTTSGWIAVNNDTTFDAVKSPVVKGYVLRDAVQATVAETTGLTQDSADENIQVVYVPVGNIVPKVPNGETPDTPATPTPYPNDPENPGKVVTPDPEKPSDPNDPTSPTTPVVPHVPGHTPKDPDGNPLKPVDPEDPSKGYIPPVPKDPTKDTEINYEKDDQKAVVRYIVEGTNVELANDPLAGKSGEAINYSTATQLAKLYVLGYELVSDGFTTAQDKNFDKDASVDQEFTVVVKAKVVPIIPTVPTNPNEPVNPNKPKEGDPIDPNTPNPEDPNTPKWTEDLIKQLDNVKEVTRTITYVDEQNNPVATTVTDKVTFTRDITVNVVTGEITYGNWVARNNDTTFDAVKSPVVKGYVLRDATQTTVAETTGLTQDSADENIQVVYVPVGNIVPKIPDGETPDAPATPTPYPNDPTNPGQVVTPDPEKPSDPNDPTSPTTPVVPHVPGYTPKDPDGNPLKPVDPEDPSKGYIPPVPKVPTEDTVITYEKDPAPQLEQKAVIKYVDQTTGKELSRDEVTGKTGDKINYSTATKIQELINQGYVVVTDEFTNGGDKSYDAVKDEDGRDPSQVYTVTVTPKIVPVVPVDPTNPTTPVKPNPGDPIDPENPTGPKWTEELLKQLDNVRTITRTITYVDEAGNTLSSTVTDQVVFTRVVRVNVVTGQIVEEEGWTAINNDTTFDAVNSPVVSGYVLKDAAQRVIGATTGLTVDSANEVVTVVYVKLGSWIPEIPGQPTDPIVYPNDPQDPSKPGTDKPVVPYVPGHTPVDPDGNPLKPVDPQDPSKGYEVPDVPQDPTKDTVIRYVKDPEPTPDPRPVPQPKPVKPTTPETPEQPSNDGNFVEPGKKDAQLPNTGEKSEAGLAALGLLGVLGGFGLVARRKKNEED